MYDFKALQEVFEIVPICMDVRMTVRDMDWRSFSKTPGIV